MSITTLSQFAISRQGRPIDLHFSGANDWTQLDRPILFMGGVHGDEPEGVQLAESTLGWLRSLPFETTTAPWILVTCLNPDGLALKRRTNGEGVDLNRNYPTRDWTSEHSEAKYYPGKRAGSEPEVRAVVEIVQKVRPRLIIHCHSWEPCIVCTGSPGRADAQRLADASGYQLVDHIGYPTPGSLSQFGWHENQIPVICIEEVEHLNNPAMTWKRFAPAIREIFLDTSLRVP